MLYPLKGGFLCRFHGGNSAPVRAAAAKRAQEAEAARQLIRFKKLPGAEPTGQLLELVQYQAGIVNWWRGKVEEVEEADLIYSLVGESEEETRFGTFTKMQRRAGAHATYKLLRESQQDLASYASQALRAGIAERQVAIAERQGSVFAGAQRAILSRLLDSLGEWFDAQGADPTTTRALAREWEQWVGTIVPEELRAIAAREQTITGEVAQ